MITTKELIVFSRIAILDEEPTHEDKMTLALMVLRELPDLDIALKVKYQGFVTWGDPRRLV